MLISNKNVMVITTCQHQLRRTDYPPPPSDDSAAKTTPEDFLSNLPDDIIVCVLSRLETIEQRAATSLLARRWRYLWKYVTCTSLTFNNGGYSSADNRKFVDRVNQIILSLGGEDCKCTTNIDNFNLFFSMNGDDGRKYQSDIDVWLSFAFQKKVKRLHMICHNGPDLNSYSLNDLFFSSRRLNHAIVLDSLTSLLLYWVEVSGELLDYILTVSPLLEELDVLCCRQSLVNFTVCGPSLKLKHLKVRCNSGLKHLYVHDMNNLESLSYSGDAKCLDIKDTPRLAKVDTLLIFRDDDTNMKDFAQMLSKLPHLETLALRALYTLLPREIIIHQLPKLRNLKRMELTIYPFGPCYVLCAALLDASPILHELRIELNDLMDSSKEEDKAGALSHPHGSLKVLEVIGFIGCQLDMGLVSYLIENTTSLEKMIVVTRQDYYGVSDLGKQQAARVRARLLLDKKLTRGTRILIK